jgi:hypothetical protein
MNTVSFSRATRPIPVWPAASALALALAAAFPLPAAAQSNAELLQELKALKARMAELEKKLEAQETKQAEVATAAPAPGMTPEQQQDFNRIAVKAEALEDSRDMLGFKGLKIGGYMDPTWVFNQRQHRAGFQFLNPVDEGGYYYDTSYIGTVALDIIKETDSGARWRLTLVPQRSTQAVSEGTSSPVQEASVSVPITDLQTRFIAGHMPDWSGYEMLQPTLNKFVTHNLLFDTTLPASYTGAGFEILRGKWLTKAMVANMAASRRQPNEKTPVLAYRVDYAKGEFQGFGFAGIHGRAANLSEGGGLDADGEVIRQRDSRVDTFEFDAYFIRGPLTLQGQVSFGRQLKASITPDPDTGRLRDAYWSGVSGLFAYKIEPWLELAARADYIWNGKNGGGLLTYAVADPFNGIGPAMVRGDDGSWAAANGGARGVDRGALSLGMNYAFNLNTVFKFEYRYDWASGPVFVDTKSNDYKKNNQLFGTAVVVSF